MESEREATVLLRSRWLNLRDGYSYLACGISGCQTRKEKANAYNKVVVSISENVTNTLTAGSSR